MAALNVGTTHVADSGNPSFWSSVRDKVRRVLAELLYRLSRYTDVYVVDRDYYNSGLFEAFYWSGKLADYARKSGALWSLWHKNPRAITKIYNMAVGIHDGLVVTYGSRYGGPPDHDSPEHKASMMFQRATNVNDAYLQMVESKVQELVDEVQRLNKENAELRRRRIPDSTEAVNA